MSADPKVAKEVAEQEFERWAEAMGLRRMFDPATLDEEDKKALAIHRGALLGAIEDGNLTVNDEGEFVFTPVMGDRTPLTFHEPDGAMLRTADTVKMGEGVSREQKLLGAITKTSASRFSGMKRRDLTICDSIFSLFLAK
jgi:hypothetical protein